MEDKLHQFFSDNNFDNNEPHSGHLDRFQRKLQQQNNPQKKTSWKWLSVAASVVLLIGFWLGNNNQQKDSLDLADVSPKMEEVQTYFVSTLHQELKEVEKFRSLETEEIIEHALERLEDLEDDYNAFTKELKNTENQKEIIYAMINNYQQRLEILEEVLKQIELIKNTKLEYNEEYI
ncbi:hypothetical protein OD91_0637 [Lutibacter sp. Hel_I_33_5]|uniref:hypothetical protein n=1 Tax=Lutibacter sp. Hel_I_33_5 TaxID=1566289 RepID=UPI00119DBA3B|nr:hypothetical protein [Lutibacter sp. Hel_I_33_5]TVZ55390.1 hypothetical protein OD91_0637 [Lutibacter sp. Hel_I_33_5]